MSDSVSADPTKQAQDLIASKMADRPLDDMSMGSIAAVSDAAELIAMAKIEAAAKAAEAAREAMARVAAMKAAAAQPPTKAIPMVPASSKEPPPAPEAKPVVVAQDKPAPEAKPAVAAEDKPAPAATPVVEAKPVATEAKVFPPEEAKAAPVPVPEPAAPVAEVKTEPAAEVAVERRESQRREDDPRRTETDRRQQAAAVENDRRLAERRMALGRREDDPSGVFRLANAVRASTSERNDRRRSVNHGEAPKVGGAVLEPVARKAGHGPVAAAGPRKIVTPKLIMLFLLMGLYGAYVTGHLPQFDEWTDSLTNKAHANNDQVVSAVTSSGHIIGCVVAGILLLVIAFFIWNSMRARESD